MGKYVILVGGELRNKGAQAMSFTSVDQIQKRYPGKTVVLLDDKDARRPQAEKDNYRFMILPSPGGTALAFAALQTKWTAWLYGKLRGGKAYADFCRILRQTDALLDISGYAFGSNWGAKNAVLYLLRARLGRAWGFPVYLMPQSFGPFDFKGRFAPAVRWLAKRVLPKVKCIMAREEEGFRGLQTHYGLKNVIKTTDLVLQSAELDLQNVYNVVPELPSVQVEPGSVAVIPNAKNNKYGDRQQVLDNYSKMIRSLLEKGKKVWLIYHALEDLAICRDIKALYEENDRVMILERELSCVEFGNIVQRFDFVIASRYHSVVHAYKAGIPALILGWAEKYRELAALMGQQDYCMDVRHMGQDTQLLDALDKMILRYKDECTHIRTALGRIQAENVYDMIEIGHGEA